MTSPTPNRRWFHLTPDRFFIGLLAVQVFLFLSERFQWFAFNEKKGWTVLIAVGVVGVAVLVMLIWGLVCLCFRRRFQFSFRSLLVFLVAVSVPLGWFAWEMQKARRQREAVEAIREMGGYARRDHEPYVEVEFVIKPDPPGPDWLFDWLLSVLGPDFVGSVVDVNLNGTQINDLMPLAGLNMERLYINRTQVSDLTPLARSKHLEELFLNDTQVHDLSPLAGLKKLKGLGLYRTQVKDITPSARITSLEQLILGKTQVAELTPLAELKNLQNLDLNRTQVSDLTPLAGLQALRWLNLDHTQVKDVMLLAGLKNLTSVSLNATPVSKEQVESLQQALPNCRISWTPSTALTP